MNIKKGDKVIVIAGKNKGATGEVTRVFRESGRVIVSGVAKVSRRIKAKKRGEKGQVVEREAAINASNVMLLEGGKGVRVSKKLVGEKKVRVSRKTGKEL